MNQNSNIHSGRNIPAALLLAIACLGVGFCASGCETAPEENFFVTHPVLPLLEFKTFVTAGKVPILDARDPQSFATGHVPGARNLPPGADFNAEYKKLEKILARHKKRCRNCLLRRSMVQPRRRIADATHRPGLQACRAFSGRVDGVAAGQIAGRTGQCKGAAMNCPGRRIAINWQWYRYGVGI